MNLPVVIDIALGLIFIYLILSLLASEVQEIITALLQWRAEHLKRSIEVLLSGNDKDHEGAAQTLSNLLYETPWIRGLNQEARGPIARTFRGVCHTVGKIYRTLTGTRNVFGQQTSGPSYIPSEAFANSLIESLNLGKLWQLMVEDRLQKFVGNKVLTPVNDILNDLKANTANEFLLNSQFRQLEETTRQIIEDFNEGRIKLPETLDRIVNQLDEFALMAKAVLPDQHHLTETFLRRLEFIKRSIASTDTEKLAILKKLRPSMEEMIAVFEDGSVTYDEVVALAERNETARKLLEGVKAKVMTPALRSSLISIAQKVEYGLDATRDELQQFTYEIEKWFDRSMERATGVYKRNSKAVAFLIGLLVAISINADTFHISARLVRDPALRNTITVAAEEFSVNQTDDRLTEQELADLQEAVNGALDQIPFPLGYGDVVLRQQQEAELTWPLPIPRRFFGWIVSGIAIGMGANFWFSLLKKVLDIRSSGSDSQ